MQRRQFVAAGVAMTAPAFISRAWGTSSGVSDREIVLGQSAHLSGPLGAWVKDYVAGAQLHFDDINAHGGINGRLVRLVSLDDELQPEKAVANYKALLAEHKAFAFFGSVGSSTVAAASAVFRESNAPLIGNLATGDSAREKARGTAYFVRATYSREAEKLVQHLSTIGITQIAVATLNNPGGAEAAQSVSRAVQAEGKAKDVVVSSAMNIDGSNVVQMGKVIAEAKPQAVIMAIAGPPVAKLMETIWETGSSPSFYGMSMVAADLIAKLLGKRLRGLATSQVVPFPWSDTEPTAIGFRKLCKAGNVQASYLSYEGYFNAMVATEGLRRAGRDLQRTGLHAAMQSLKMRIAGVDVDFTGGRITGSRFVDLVQVTSDGRFLR